MNPAQSVGQTEKISQVSQVLSYHVECMVFLQQHKNTPNISSTDELTIFMILWRYLNWIEHSHKHVNSPTEK